MFGTLSGLFNGFNHLQPLSTVLIFWAVGITLLSVCCGEVVHKAGGLVTMF